MRGLRLVRSPNEEGATAVIVALSLVALMGMVVLTVDVGGLVARRREMVNTSDAAALAAAQTFAIGENGAVCGSVEDPAVAQADALAAANVAGATRLVFTTHCAEQTVDVKYEKQQDLFFAPVLGFGDTSNVNATATALWGTSTGGNPAPIELDPTTTDNCVFVNGNPDQGYNQPGPCPSGYWFNNQDLSNSGWGFISLLDWGVPWDDGCSNEGGSSALGDWIDQSDPVPVSLPSIPTYACITDGHRDSTWFDKLVSMRGKVLLFPVNDPAQMVVQNPWLPTQKEVTSASQEKYAIVAFAPMLVKDVYHGNDPAAIGTPATPAQTGSCGNNGTSLALDAAGQRNLGSLADTACGGPDYLANVSAYHVSNVVVTSGQGSNKTTYVGCDATSGTNCDYRFNADNTQTVNGIPPLTLVWVNPATRSDAGKTVKLDWSVDGTPGTPGACGIQQSDPNATCLVLEWAGPQLIGSDPQPGNGGYGAKSVTLVK